MQWKLDGLSGSGATKDQNWISILSDLEQSCEVLDPLLQARGLEVARVATGRSGLIKRRCCRRRRYNESQLVHLPISVFVVETWRMLLASQWSPPPFPEGSPDILLDMQTVLSTKTALADPIWPSLQTSWAEGRGAPPRSC